MRKAILTVIPFFILLSSVFAGSISALHLVKDSTSSKLQSKQLLIQGNNYWEMGNNELALKKYLEALKLVEQGQDNQTKGQIYSKLSKIYAELRLFSKAIEIELKALKIFNNINNLSGEGNSNINLGLYYAALDTTWISRGHLDKAVEIKTLLDDDPSGLGKALNAIGLLFKTESVQDSALLYFDNAFQNYVMVEDFTMMADVQTNIGYTYSDKGDHKSSLNSFLLAEEYASKSNSVKVLSYIYIGLANVYRDLDQHDNASLYYTSYISLRDSLFSESSSRQLIELEVKYEAERSKKEIVELEKKNLANQLNVSKQKEANNRLYLTIFVLIVILASGLLLFRTMRQKARLKSILSKKVNNQLQKDLDNLEVQNKIESLQSLINGETQERGRIARELHDGLGGSLALMKLKIEQKIEQESDLQQKVELQQISGQIIKTIEEVRQISHKMLPESIQQLGMLYAVKEFANQVEQASNLTIEIKVLGDPFKIDQIAEIAFFRIIQEATNNVLKHGNANSLLIQFTYRDSVLNIFIEDNGTGFEINTETNGIGLTNMKNRADNIGSSFVIESEKGLGTSIMMEIFSKTDNTS